MYNGTIQDDLEPGKYKIIGTRTFNLESLGSISVADVGR